MTSVQTTEQFDEAVKMTRISPIVGPKFNSDFKVLNVKDDPISSDFENHLVQMIWQVCRLKLVAKQMQDLTIEFSKSDLTFDSNELEQKSTHLNQFFSLLNAAKAKLDYAKQIAEIQAREQQSLS